MHKLSVVSVEVFTDNNHTKQKEYDAEDIANWYIETRGFPEILVFGRGKNKISGEGQSGGRLVSEVAKEVENKIIDRIGEKHYFYLLNEFLHPEINEGISYEDVDED